MSTRHDTVLSPSLHDRFSGIHMPAGYVEASCLACDAALFVPAHERVGDVLCPQCRREGEAAAEMDAHFGEDDRLTEDDIDRLYVEEMTRREREDPTDPCLHPHVRFTLDGCFPTYPSVRMACDSCGASVWSQKEMNPTVTCAACWQRRAARAG